MSYSTTEKVLAVMGENVDESDSEHSNDREKERELECLEEEVAQLITKRNTIRRNIETEEILYDVMGVLMNTVKNNY